MKQHHLRILHFHACEPPLLKKNIRGFVYNGAFLPRRGYSELMASPKIIKNEMLSTTDKTTLSVSHSLFSLKT